MSGPLVAVLTLSVACLVVGAAAYLKGYEDGRRARENARRGWIR